MCLMPEINLRRTPKNKTQDTFTHHGVEVTRRVFIEGSALGISGATGQASTSAMRDWRGSDASKCGSFGIWISDANGVGVNVKCPGKFVTSCWL